MFCPECGSKLSKGSQYCSQCGINLNNEVITKKNTENSVPSFIWGLVGFFVPLAGLILFILWKQDRKKDSKAAGLGALIWLICYVLAIISIIIISIFTYMIY